MIHTPIENKSKIDRIYVKFDIPGEFQTFEREDRSFENIDNCNVKSSIFY